MPDATGQLDGFENLISRWVGPISGITQFNAVWRQYDHIVQTSGQRWVNRSRQFEKLFQIVCLGKMNCLRCEKGLEVLLRRLLTMKHDGFGELQFVFDQVFGELKISLGLSAPFGHELLPNSVIGLHR